MRYENVMGTRRFDTVFDYSKNGCMIAVTCVCGHKAHLDPKEVSKVCIRKGLDLRIPAIRARLKCSACGNRDVQCGPAVQD